MTEEMKNKKMDARMLDSVAGGSSKEMESDERAVAAMLGLNMDEVNPGIVAEAFEKGKVKVNISSGDKANEYFYNGRRISRYEALVRLGRGNGKGAFDITPYLSDSHSDNASRNI